MVAMSRRQALTSFLFGAGGVGLRSLASGIPAALLLNPRKALAATSTAGTGAPATIAQPQYLILATSENGDPVNGNVPGTYEDPGIVHPVSNTMAPTALTLSGTKVTAAAPWAALPQTLLDRTTFFHHSTNTVVHGDEGSVLTLGGSVAGNDMLVSMLASQTGPALGTVQSAPVCVGAQDGGEAISYEGRVQPILSASSLASVLTLPNGPLSNLQKLRDSTLNDLNAWYRSQGGSAQQNFIDQYATSQTQLRSLSDSLFSKLAVIQDNSPASQIVAAVALIQMNIAPVITIHIPMGGDNHGDSQLTGEAAQQVSGIASIASLYQQLGAVNLQDRVSFMMLNVFGRTMAVSHEGTNGRDHNGNHHCTVMIGANLKGSVVGGVAPMDGDYGALPINSQTGSGGAGGDITFANTFASMGKTVGRAVGVLETYLDANISNGTAVTACLNGV